MLGIDEALIRSKGSRLGKSDSVTSSPSRHPPLFVKDHVTDSEHDDSSHDSDVDDDHDNAAEKGFLYFIFIFFCDSTFKIICCFQIFHTCYYKENNVQAISKDGCVSLFFVILVRAILIFWFCL